MSGDLTRDQLEAAHESHSQQSLRHYNRHGTPSVSEAKSFTTANVQRRHDTSRGTSVAGSTGSSSVLVENTRAKLQKLNEQLKMLK